MPMTGVTTASKRARKDERTRFDGYSRARQEVTVEDYFMAVSYTHLDVYKRQACYRVAYRVLRESSFVDLHGAQTY